LEAINPPSVGRFSVGDTETAILILTVTPHGVKSSYRYGRENGKPTRAKLGRFPEMTVEQARDRCEARTGKAATSTGSPDP